MAPKAKGKSRRVASEDNDADSDSTTVIQSPCASNIGKKVKKGKGAAASDSQSDGEVEEVTLKFLIDQLTEKRCGPSRPRVRAVRSLIV